MLFFIEVAENLFSPQVRNYIHNRVTVCQEKMGVKCAAHFGPFSNSSSSYLHMYLDNAGIVPENQATRWGGQGSIVPEES